MVVHRALLLVVLGMLGAGGCRDVRVEAVYAADDSEESGDTGDSALVNDAQGVLGSVEGIQFPLPDPSDDCAQVARLTPVVGGDQVVVTVGQDGDGCTPEALHGALETINALGGGQLRFACGDDPVVFSLVSPLDVADGVRVTFHGGGQVILDGRDGHPILRVGHGAQVALEALVLARGRATGSERGGALSAPDLGADGALVIDQCLFVGNVSQQTDGGAVFAAGGGSVWIRRSVFSGNHASSGGALFVQVDSVTVTDTVFSENSGFRSGGAVQISGLGRSHHASSLCGVRFVGNTSVGRGAAVSSSLEASGTVEARFVLLEDNATVAQVAFGDERAPGIWAHAGGSLVMDSCSFVNNESSTDGAGIFVSDGHVSLVNTSWLHNRVTAWDGRGGAVLVEGGAEVDVINGTLADNVAASGAAIARLPSAQVTVRGSILAGNGDLLGDPAGCAGAVHMEESTMWPQEDTSCGSDVLLCDPELTTPGFYGALVLTSVPQGACVAGVVTACPDVDATGRHRGTPCSAGAVEPSQ